MIFLAGCWMNSCGSHRTAVPPEFVADAISIDRGGRQVTWLVKCGEHEGDRLKTSVASATSEYETNIDDPAHGHVNAVSFVEWAGMESRSGPWVVKSKDEKVASVVSFSAPADHDPCSR
jgi:hypothetical protein